MPRVGLLGPAAGTSSPTKMIRQQQAAGGHGRGRGPAHHAAAYQGEKERVGSGSNVEVGCLEFGCDAEIHARHALPQ